MHCLLMEEASDGHGPDKIFRRDDPSEAATEVPLAVTSSTCSSSSSGIASRGDHLFPPGDGTVVKAQEEDIIDEVDIADAVEAIWHGRELTSMETSHSFLATIPDSSQHVPLPLERVLTSTNTTRTAGAVQRANVDLPAVDNRTPCLHLPTLFDFSRAPPTSTTTHRVLGEDEDGNSTTSGGATFYHAPLVAQPASMTRETPPLARDRYPCPPPPLQRPPPLSHSSSTSSSNSRPSSQQRTDRSTFSMSCQFISSMTESLTKLFCPSGVDDERDSFFGSIDDYRNHRNGSEPRPCSSSSLSSSAVSAAVDESTENHAIGSANVAGGDKFPWNSGQHFPSSCLSACMDFPCTRDAYHASKRGGKWCPTDCGSVYSYPCGETKPGSCVLCETASLCHRDIERTKRVLERDIHNLLGATSKEAGRVLQTLQTLCANMECFHSGGSGGCSGGCDDDQCRGPLLLRGGGYGSGFDRHNGSLDGGTETSTAQHRITGGRNAQARKAGHLMRNLSHSNGGSFGIGAAAVSPSVRASSSRMFSAVVGPQHHPVVVSQSCDDEIAFSRVSTTTVQKRNHNFWDLSRYDEDDVISCISHQTAKSLYYDSDPGECSPYQHQRGNPRVVAHQHAMIQIAAQKEESYQAESDVGVDKSENDEEAVGLGESDQVMKGDEGSIEKKAIRDPISLADSLDEEDFHELEKSDEPLNERYDSIVARSISYLLNGHIILVWHPAKTAALDSNKRTIRCEPGHPIEANQEKEKGSAADDREKKKSKYLNNGPRGCRGGWGSSNPISVKAWIERGSKLKDNRVIHPKFMWKAIHDDFPCRSSDDQQLLTLDRRRRAMGSYNERNNVIKTSSSQRHHHRRRKSKSPECLDMLGIIRIVKPRHIDRTLYPFAKAKHSFLVTSYDDETFLFEAGNEVDRDRAANGLKLAVARLTSKIMIGAVDVLDEFYTPWSPATILFQGDCNDQEQQGSTPSEQTADVPESVEHTQEETEDTSSHASDLQVNNVAASGARSDGLNVLYYPNYNGIDIFGTW